VNGGRGVLLGGVPGVAPGTVLILGGGVVGFNAAQMAAGLGADVTIMDNNPEALERLSLHFESRAKTRLSNQANLLDALSRADLVIGSRSEEHTSELQSRENLACRLLLEKK